MLEILQQIHKQVHIWDGIITQELIHQTESY